MPPNARLLASNETGVQAFRHEQVYATQFHPEYDLQTAEAMIHSKNLSDRAIQQALDTCTESNVEAARPAKQIFDNFLVQVATARTTASPSNA